MRVDPFAGVTIGDVPHTFSTVAVRSERINGDMLSTADACVGRDGGDNGADTSLPVRDIGKTTHRHNVSVVWSSCFLHGKDRGFLQKDVIPKYSLTHLLSEVTIISGRVGKQSGARNLQRLYFAQY